MLILIRGLPGSGKSTLAGRLQERCSLIHLEADMFFINDQGEYQFDPLQLGAAHLWCQKQANQALKQGRSVVVSNTFTELWEMNPYLRMARALQHDIQIYECHEQYQNVHNVPEQTIAKMEKRWQKLPTDLQVYQVRS